MKTKETFDLAKIGMQDSKGEELYNGDKIEIYLTKNTKQTGVIVYERGAFCLKANRNGIGNETTTPIANYAYYCLITKLKQ
jgi:hypothetical protein